MEQTKSIIYRHPASDVEKTEVYAVEVLNADEFFGCRFLIRAVPIGTKDRLQMMMRGIVNCEEFREFWARQDVKVPEMLHVIDAVCAYETAYHYIVHPEEQVAIPLWAKGYTPQHARSHLRNTLINMGHNPERCEVEEV